MATTNHNPDHRTVLFQCMLEATSAAERDAARRAWRMAEEEEFRRCREFCEELGRTVEASSGYRIAAHEATASFCRLLVDPHVELYWLINSVLDDANSTDREDAFKEYVRRHAEIDEEVEAILRRLNSMRALGGVKETKRHH